MGTSENIRPQSKGSKVLFKNPILEKLTKTHIAIPLTIFSVYSTVLLYWSITQTPLGIFLTTSLFLIGLLAFTLIEYIAHKYLFHITVNSESRKKFQYTIHGVHHDYPKDKKRLAMPPILSITIATILLLVFRLIMGDFAYVFLPGFLMGYAGYLFVHYIVHAYQPPKNFFKILWIHHGIHHYKEPERAFGVSSPLWDLVFRTMPRR